MSRARKLEQLRQGAIVGCMTVAIMPVPPILDSRKGQQANCAACGEAIWLSPGTQDLLHEKPHVKPVCWPCIDRHDLLAGRFLAMTPGQERDVAIQRRQQAERN